MRSGGVGPQEVAMSEAKTVAKSLNEVVPGLFHIRIHDERIDHNSEAYALVDAGKVILIDPVRVEEAALKRLGPVEAIVIARPGHQRSAWHHRKASKAKVYAPAGAKELDETPDVVFKDGDRLPGGLRAVAAPGPKAPHYALYLDRGPGVLFLTDLMMHEPDAGVVFLPDKYMEEPARGPESARRLLDLKFDVVCFGHGAPITKGGRKAIEEAVKRRGAKKK